MASATASDDAPAVSRGDRLLKLYERLAELSGQRNAIDGQIVEIVAEIDRDGLWAGTGLKSVKALVAWRLGMSETTAGNVAAVADRYDEFPRCTTEMREGRLSLDQVGVIAAHAGEGSDDHYADFAAVATVRQIRKALSLEVRPEPEREPEPEFKRSFSRSSGDNYTTYRITVPNLEAAKVDAALASHRDALINEYRRDHGPDTAGDPDAPSFAASGQYEREKAQGTKPPFPTLTDAFMRMVETAWDAEVARRPHSAHTTVMVHLDVDKRASWIHAGPALSDADRQYLLCDADCEIWLEQRGQVIGTGRSTRVISRRLRRALEYRNNTCAVPGCGATRGLHAHHIQHWEDGGVTELHNLVLVCPHHHRMHHRGEITIRAPADQLVVCDRDGDPITNASLARPPTQPPPAVPPWHGPLGQRAEWWWYEPYKPSPN
ncbi:HNH endonuclease signature motif containing protein [Mycolicibacterium rutilum]|uniref:HNH endonuclease signature motif containing protein n=1 Tax=Mycolicibacterium rutilum TaxID=370526 RepID=UPI0009F3CA24|nr:HNH endonuclease signature motif containing protein [Mycolicibacterium rutilum]